MPSLFAGLDKLPQQLAVFWSRLSGAQRFAFLSIMLMTLGAGTLLVNVASESDYAILYSQLSPGASTGRSPTTPGRLTCSTWPSASVMAQCRESSWTVVSPSFAIRM